MMYEKYASIIEALKSWSRERTGWQGIPQLVETAKRLTGVRVGMTQAVKILQYLDKKKIAKRVEVKGADGGLIDITWIYNEDNLVG